MVQKLEPSVIRYSVLPAKSTLVFVATQQQCSLTVREISRLRVSLVPSGLKSNFP